MNALAPLEARPLRPQLTDNPRAVLALIFSAYPEPYKDMRAEQREALDRARVEAYLTGLAGFPEWALREAYADFVAGRVERSAKARGKLPTAEEIATVARSHVEKAAVRQSIERNRQKQLSERQQPETPQARARMRFKMAVLSASMRLKRADDVARAEEDGGLDGYIALAQAWGVPVPEDIWEMRK